MPRHAAVLPMLLMLPGYAATFEGTSQMGSASTLVGITMAPDTASVPALPVAYK
jgi:hypothetical protein